LATLLPILLQNQQLSCRFAENHRPDIPFDRSPLIVNPLGWVEPWPKIVSMRNGRIHGYDVVDYDTLWDTITEDLPLLITELERIIPKQTKQ